MRTRVFTRKAVNHLAPAIFLLFITLAISPPAEASPEKSSVNQIAPLVVTATKTPEKVMDLPFSVSVVTREEIDRMGAATLEQALRAVPGLQIGTQGNAYPHIEVRGFRDTKDLAVLINGIPFRQINGSADLTMIPIGIVERIEFVKGPGSSIWGRGAVAGTLNIITTPADTERQQAKVQAGGGSYDTCRGDAMAVVPYSGGYFMMNAGGATSDGYQDGTGRDAQNALLALHHRFTEEFHLCVQYLFSNVEAGRGSTIPIVDGEPAFGVDPEDNFGIYGASYDGRYHAITLSPVLTLFEGLTLKNDFSYTRFDRYATGGITVVAGASNKGWWESDSDQRSIHNDLNLTWQRNMGGWDNTLLVGGYLESGSQDQFNPKYSWSSMPKYGPPGWDVPLSNPDNPAKGIRSDTGTASDFDQAILSFYAQDSIRAGTFGFMAGVRYDSFDEELKLSTTDVKADQSESAWSPRFAADWMVYDGPDASVTLFGNYVEGFRTQFPKLSTRSGVTLPQLLDPEETESQEGGVKVLAQGGRLFTQASVFKTEKKGPRSYRTSADDFLFTNARTRVEGVEAELRYRVNALVDFWCHYAYHDAYYLEFTNKSGTSFAGNRVRMSPRHMAGAGLNLKYRKFNWNVSANYVGDRNLRDNTTSGLQNLSSYTTVNTALSYTLGRYELQFVLNNIFDEEYIADDFSSKDAGFPGDPRNFFLWLRAEF